MLDEYNRKLSGDNAGLIPFFQPLDLCIAIKATLKKRKYLRRPDHYSVDSHLPEVLRRKSRALHHRHFVPFHGERWHHRGLALWSVRSNFRRASAQRHCPSLISMKSHHMAGFCRHPFMRLVRVDSLQKKKLILAH
jgi:hypothetical protein